ncbi:hypothetical protein SDC9_166358 [bioreactor metagenome]|uniref:Uncharacterized protein n=1 Tax=bioreactor metagenome TaxID=1076179 RepID=A0A645FZ62_9ZZZZ
MDPAQAAGCRLPAQPAHDQPHDGAHLQRLGQHLFRQSLQLQAVAWRPARPPGCGLERPGAGHPGARGLERDQRHHRLDHRPDRHRLGRRQRVRQRRLAHRPGRHLAPTDRDDAGHAPTDRRHDRPAGDLDAYQGHLRTHAADRRRTPRGTHRF